MTYTEIIHRVADMTGVSEADIRARHRDNPRSKARQLAILLVHEMTGKSLEGVGRVFGRRHSTILYSIRQGRELVKTEAWARDVYQAIKGA